MFDIDEINILLEALNDWVASVVRKNAMGSLLTAMLIGVHMEGKDKENFKEQMLEDADKAKQETESREERAILLKAKLIRMRQELMAKEAADCLRMG